MTNIFTILAVVFLSLSAFIAFRSKGLYKDQIDAVKKEQTAVKDKKAKYANFDSEVEKMRNVDMPAVQKNNEELTDQVEKLTAKTTELEESKLEKESLLAEKEEEAKRSQEILDGAQNVPELVKQVETLKQKSAASEDRATAIATQISSLRIRETRAERRFNQLEEANRSRRNKMSNPKLRTKIREVIRSSGFVTLSGGDNLGIVKGSILHVLRGNKVIAKLRVSVVEANTAAADILYESMEEGTRLHAGNIVVAEKVSAVPAKSPRS